MMMVDTSEVRWDGYQDWLLHWGAREVGVGRRCAKACLIMRVGVMTVRGREVPGDSGSA